MQVELHSYEDIGAYLREVRESLGFDTRDIGRSLNIRAKYLTALEEGKIDVMPGKTYARGYLQNYAEYLGLDKEGIAEAFDRLNSGGGKMRYFVPEPTNRNYQPGMLVVGVALVVVLTVYYYWYNNHHTNIPSDYQRVSPVPERLVDPIIEEPEMQENDDLFIGPYYRQNESLQGDSNLTPSGATVQDGAARPDADVTQASPVAEEAEAVEEPEKSEETIPPAPATKRKLPWLNRKEAAQ